MAKAEVGYTESPPNSNRTKYGEAYGWNGVAWCVIFVWWCFRKTNLLIKTASSTTLYNWFKGKKRVFSKPKVGDVVFFNFDKKPKPGECTHTGIVVQIVNATHFRTVEGNTSFEKETDGSPAKEANGGAVALRTRTFDKTLIGFGRPDYNSIDGSNEPEKTVSAPIKTKILKIGSKGPDVVRLHEVLFSKGYGVSKTNQLYDALTERCVKHFQAANGLEIDGIVGPKTADKLNLIL